MDEVPLLEAALLAFDEQEGLAEEEGEVLLSGEPNCNSKDSRSDVAIGVPYEDLGGLANAGVVHLIYGSATGLTATGNQQWHQDTAGIEDAVQAGDRFG